MPRPSAELTNTKDSLFDAVSSINDKMNDINSTMRTASNQLTDKMRAVTAQVSVVSNLMLDAVEEISDPGSKTIYEDESEDLIASQSDGKIENSINRGTIDADMNVGGIAGTMGVENLLDPEEDNKDEGTSLLRTSYTVSAVLTGNINEAACTAKKDMVGGIVGQEELGLVTACESYGDVTGVNQVAALPVQPAPSSAATGQNAPSAVKSTSAASSVRVPTATSPTAASSPSTTAPSSLCWKASSTWVLSPADRTATSMATSSSPTICRASTA